MPAQQGIMSAYQLMVHTHEAVGQGGQLDYIESLLNKPWIDVREYGSFALAVAAIGATERTLVISEDCPVAADIIVPRNITLRFMQGGSLTVANLMTVEFNCPIVAEGYQIFYYVGTGVVVFDYYRMQNLEVRPEWWGGLSDGSANASPAFAAMLAALPVDGFCGVRLSTGFYLVEGNPAIFFNKSVKVIGNKTTILYRQDDTCVMAGAVAGAQLAWFEMEDVHIYREYAGGAVPAANDLLGHGLVLQNLVNFRIKFPIVDGFERGIYLLGNQEGTSYGNIFEPYLPNNLIGFCADEVAHASSWVTNVQVFGGRIDISEVYSDHVGSRAVAILATNIINHRVSTLRFYGTSLEGTVWERKVLNHGNLCVFNDCIWDAPGGGTDIELTANSESTRLNGGNNLEYQVIVDNGDRNEITGVDRRILGKAPRCIIDGAGEITVTQSHHTVDTFAAAATDELTDIAGGFDGQEVTLRQYDNARVVTIRTTGNIYMGGDRRLLTAYYPVKLMWAADLNKWLEISTATKMLEASHVWDAPNIGNGAEEDAAIAVAGAVVGDFCMISCSIDVLDLALNAQVTAPNLVTISLLNNTGAGVDLGNATYRVKVFRF